MKVGVFCKTFADDLDWFQLALASFRKFWRHPDTVWTVVLDRDCRGRLLLDGDIRTFFIESWPDGYAHAMALKACADIFCGEECKLILLFDSDMMMTRPTELKDLMGPVPTVYYENWCDSERSLMARQVWSPASLRSTGKLLDRDYMVSPVWLYWASTFRNARQLVQDHAGMPFLQAVYSRTPYDWRRFPIHPMTFCDIENLGLAALWMEPDKYQFAPIEGHRDLPISQHWSHSDFESAKPELLKVLQS